MHKENYRAFCKWAREKKYRLTTDAEKYFVSTHTQSAWMLGTVRLCVNTQINGMMKQSV
jgi:hypothetical protein